MKLTLVRLSALSFVAALAAAGGLLLFALGETGPARGQLLGGPVYVSGDDAEDHCQATDCGGLMVAVLSNIVSLSQSPGNGIAAIGMEDEDNTEALESWKDPANGGPDVPITVITLAQIPTVDFAQFDVIFVPSNEDDGDEVGIDDAELAALNARKADIVAFVNNLGGGLIALTEADSDPALAFGFLPIPLEFQVVSYVDVEPAPALAALAPDADSDNMDHDNWHNIWTGPPGFSGLDVLVVTPEVLDEGDNPSAAALGGAQVFLLPEGPFGDDTCSDEIDNDGDTLTDAADPDCAPPVTPAPSPSPTVIPTPSLTPVASPAVEPPAALPESGGPPQDSGASVWIAALVIALGLAFGGGVSFAVLRRRVDR